MPSSVNLSGLRDIFPAKRFSAGAAFRAAFESDGLTAFRQAPLAVVMPETDDEVIQAVQWVLRKRDAVRRTW